MGVSGLMDVANTAIGAAANKLCDTHTAESFEPIRTALIGVGLPADTYDRLGALATEYQSVHARREALDDAFEGEAIDPQLDAARAHRWIKILHASARAYASDNAPDAPKVMRKLGVGTSPSDNPREASLSVGKLLTALELLGDPIPLYLPPGFIVEGKTISGTLRADEKDRDQGLTARQMATRRMGQLEDQLQMIFEQVLARAELLEEISGEPIPGVDFGYLRAAAAAPRDGGGGADAAPSAPSSAPDAQNTSDEPGL